MLMSFRPSRRYRPQHGAAPGRPTAPALIDLAARKVPDAANVSADAGEAIEAQPPADTKVETTQATESNSRSNSSMARNSMIMFLGTLVSRLLGMVRSPILLGAVVGLSTPLANSFNLANNIPNLLYGIIAGGLINAVLVPAIVKATERSKREGEIFINKLVTFAVVVIGAITLALTLAAPIVVKLYAATMSDEWFRLTVIFAYWCLPQIFFYAMYAVLGQILNAYERFGPYMWSPVLNNLVAIAGMILVLVIFGPENANDPSGSTDWSGMQIALLAGFSTLGIILQAAILLWPLYRLGLRFKPDFQWRNSGLTDVGKTGFWVIAYVLVGTLPLIVLMNMAVGATERAMDAGMDITQVAGNATYQVAYALYVLPNSLIAISILTAIFPRMARAVTRGKFDDVRSDTSMAIRSILVFNALATSGFIALSIPVSRLIVPTVTANETIALSHVLIAMAIALLFAPIYMTTTKTFYALEKTYLAFWTTLPSVVVTILGYLALGGTDPRRTLIYLVLVKSAGDLLTAIIQFVVARREIGGLETVKVLTAYAKMTLAGVIAGVVGWVAVGFIGRENAASSVSLSFILCIGVGVLMSVIYLGALKAMRAPEADALLRPVRRIASKLARR